MPGTLFVVATPIGNLDDISIRARAVLGRVTVIAAEDTRRTAKLLARYAITTPTTSLHAHNEEKKTGSLIERLSRGADIALVSDAGTPTVSDPGARLIRAAINAGIRVEPIPGASAVLAALVASGLPGDTFTFLGFPPTRASARNAWFDQVLKAGRTVVFFEAPHRIRATLEEILARLGDRNVVVARELTKVHEELVRGPISEVLGRLRSPQGEFTVVVEIGQLANISPDAPACDESIAAEFGQLTNTSGLTRRRAISQIARKHRRPANDIYSAIERAKKLVKQQKPE